MAATRRVSLTRLRQIRRSTGLTIACGKNPFFLFRKQRTSCATQSMTHVSSQRWLYRRGHKDVVNYAIRRLGILDQDDRRFKRNQWAFFGE
jgi:hypothetical protein